MLNAALIPTPLIEEREKHVVVMSPVRQASAFRVFDLGTKFGRWFLRMLWLYATFSATPKARGRITREMMEELGGLWVKVGQFVAMRTDLFGVEFCHELAQLHDRANGFPHEMAVRILEQDLGPLEDVFESFPSSPLAAASIGQIYRCRLKREQVEVAVKVQRPSIRADIKRDMRYLSAAAKVMNLLMPVGRWSELVWEIESTLKEEVDYRIETEYLARMRKSLRRHKVTVPMVYRRYCTGRVLVMEFVDGVSMAEYVQVLQTDLDRLIRWLETNNIEPKKVGVRLYLSYSRQVYEENLFHGDLHPGNILLLKNNRVALIDFGSVGSLESGFKKRYDMMGRAMARNEYEKVADLLVLFMGAVPRGIDLDRVRQDLVNCMRLWEVRVRTKRLPYHEKSVATVIAEMTAIMVRHRIPGSWELLRLNRAARTLDASLAFLAPEADYLKLLGKYFQDKEVRSLETSYTAQSNILRVHRLTRAMADIPDQIEDMLYYEGEWMRKRAQNFAAQTSKVAYFFELVALNVALVIAAGTTLTAIGYVGQHRPELLEEPLRTVVRDWARSFPTLQAMTWAAIGGAHVYLLLTAYKLKRRFAEKGEH